MSDLATIQGSSTVISSDLSDRFAVLSGDHNPLHVDPVVARRYQFGHTVIHGVHGTLWALDCLLGALAGNQALTNLSVNYSKPVKQGDTLELTAVETAPGQYKLDVFNAGKKAQVIKVSLTEHSVSSSQTQYTESVTAPRQLSLQQAETLSDRFPLTWQQDNAQALFPHLFAKAPHAQVAFVLGLTNIVGMRCPGMDSVFAGLKAEFASPLAQADTLDFSVEKADPRFSRVLIDAQNSVANASIEALFRPQPVTQPDMALIQPLVPAEVFAGQKALVVGGSRGLGETTAKILAAGGAQVTVTYSRGQDEAQKIVADIRSSGANADALGLNVLAPTEATCQQVAEGEYTHLYYFASPLIEKNDDLFDTALFSRFCDFYVGGLARLVNEIAADKARRKRPLTLFIPSTVFIEAPKKGFAEYIAAKMAAETAVEQWLLKFPQWRASMPRLKPMLTDQTAAVVQDTPEDTVNSMLVYLQQEAAGND